MDESLRQEVLQYLNSPNGTLSAPPRVPGTTDSTPQVVKDATAASIIARPAHMRSAEENAFVQEVNDYQVATTMSKPGGSLSTDETSQLRGAVLTWLKDNGR